MGFYRPMQVNSGPLSACVKVHDGVNSYYAGTGKSWCSEQKIRNSSFRGNFNKPITIGNNISDFSEFLYDCTVFNQPLTFPQNTINLTRTLQGCYNFNSPITILSDMVNTTYYFLGACYNFNSTINFVNNTVGNNCSFSNMFQGCNNFNQTVVIPKGVGNCDGMFVNCQKFNRLVNIPNSVISCNNMFYNCKNFDASVVVNGGMVSGCSLVNCVGMFANCTNLNHPPQIPHSVINCRMMFANCNNSFNNRTIYIPSNVRDMYQMFANCNGASISVYLGYNNLKATNTQRNFVGMFGGHYAGMINIFTSDDMRYIIVSKTGSDSIVEGSITWSTMGNGVRYNTMHNIYIYNNYTNTY